MKYHLYLMSIGLILMTEGIVGCKQPEKKDTAIKLTSFYLQGIVDKMTEISYNKEKEILNIQGQVIGQDSGTILQFFDQSSCSGTPLGEGSVGDFGTKGIQVSLDSTKRTQISIKIFEWDPLKQSECTFLIEYDPVRSPPAVPVFSSYAPSSPSRESTRPVIHGLSGSQNTSKITFYDDLQCMREIGAGTPNDFSALGNGVQVEVGPNQKSTVYARSFEPFGLSSECIWLFDYIHDSISPDGPIFLATKPGSPSSLTNSPVVIGKLLSDAVRIVLSDDAACNHVLSQGTKQEFETVGLTVKVLENNATTIWGQTWDEAGNASLCTELTKFVHDSISPSGPLVFVAANPVSPTRSTLYPKIIGRGSEDSIEIKLFSEKDCENIIGSGTRYLFESAGISARTEINAITLIYGQSFDGAGNPSVCTFLTDYLNDSLPPELPFFGTTIPASPNNRSGRPWISGIVSTDTSMLDFYDDISCSGAKIGSGSSADFSGTGIRINVPVNNDTSIYAIAFDAVGNPTVCTFLTIYQYWVIPAPDPIFVKSMPISPSNLTHNPMIQGTTVKNTVSVQLYNEPTCAEKGTDFNSHALLGSGTYTDFTITGIRASLPDNSTTNIYALVTNTFSNASACTFMMTYIHDDIPPENPSFVSSVPMSPTNSSYTPFIQGSASADTVSLSLYDSSMCTNKIGTGSRSEFSSPGIMISLPPNTVTPIYTKAVDQASNHTGCVYLMTYRHDNLGPKKPSFVQASPPTPSYTQATTIRGTSSIDTTRVALFSDTGCTQSLASAPKSIFDTTGILIVPLHNTITPLHAIAYDDLDNPSPCTPMLDYNHNDLGPKELTAQLGADGTVNLSWKMDLNASNYIIKRSTIPGGPYTVLDKALVSSLYNDPYIADQTTYYYVVASTNATGTSKNSAELSVPVSIILPEPIAGLTATPGDSQVQLVWNGISSAISYTVSRGTKPGGPYFPVATDLYKINHFLDKTVINDTPYYYVVTGMNPAGWGPYSNEAGVLPKAIPSPPTGLRAATLSNGTIQLVWSHPTYSDERYIIYCAGNSGGPYHNYYSYYITPVGQRSQVMSPCSWNSYFVVTAGWGTTLNLPTPQSAYSNEAVAYVNSAPSWNVFPANTLNSYPFAGDNEVVLSWSASNLWNWGINPYLSYQINRCKTANGSCTILDPAFAGTFYVDRTAVNGTAYYYTVTGNSGAFKGLTSQQMSAMPAPPPAAPGNLVLNVNPATKIPTLTWSIPGYTNYFNIYRGTKSGGPYFWIGASLMDLDHGISTFTDINPLASIGYYIVKAKWGTKETGPSNEGYYRNGSVLGLAASSQTGKVVLNWTKFTGANSYRIKRSIVSGGPYSELSGATLETSFTDTSVVAGTGYYYYVVSANFSDLSESLHSNEVKALQAGSGTVPTGFQLGNVTTGSVGLKWAPVANATAYKVYLATLPTGTPTLNLSLTGSSTSATILKVGKAGLSANTLYYFTLTSTVGGVESPKSPQLVAFTANPPGAPLVQGADSKVLVSWTPCQKVTCSYTLQRSTNAILFSDVTTLVSSSFLDQSVVNNTLYFYRVQVVTAGGAVTRISKVSTGVTPGMVPGVPSGLTVTTIDETKLNLIWGNVVGVKCYNVKRSNSISGPFNLLQTVCQNSMTDSLLTTGSVYYYVVSALSGNYSSGVYMESADSSPVAFGVPLGIPLPPQITFIGTGRVDLNWSPVQNAIAYDLEVSEDTVHFNSLAVGLASTQYIDMTVQDGVPVFYRYRAQLPLGLYSLYSPYSSEINPGAPNLVPVGFSIESSGADAVILQWVTVPRADHYVVKRSEIPGGPYTAISSTTGISISDSGLVPGNSYFYVVSSFSGPLGVESANSLEVGLSLVAAPTGFSASNDQGSIKLSWDPVVGAISYNLSRGVSTGGPYGLIASGIASPSYTDVIEPREDTTYYYRVTSSYISGAISRDSAEAFATSAKRMNLEVPIELTDISLSSLTSDKLFERTRTSLDTDRYDGSAVDYYIDIVAVNLDSSPRKVSFVDSRGSVVGTILVPATQLQSARMRAIFIPNPGWDTYQLLLDGTNTINQLEVKSARAIIRQTGASKTKLYIPLLTSKENQIFSTTLGSYSEIPFASVFQKNSNALSALDKFNAWELETLISAENGAAGYVALFNQTLNNPVWSTETLFAGDGAGDGAGNGMMHALSPFDEGVNGFGTANELHKFQVALKCDSGCESGSVAIHKAGLWVVLNPVLKAEVIYRVSMGISGVGTPKYFDEERTFMNLAAFSNPITFFQIVGKSAVDSSAAIDLMTDGVNDVGYTGLSPVAGSRLNLNSINKGIFRTTPVGINSGERFLIHVDPTTGPSIGPTDLIDASIIVQTSR